MSALRVSALGGDSIDDLPGDETDAELEEVERQITDAQTALDAIQRNSAHRRSQYESELAELGEKIERAKEIAADALDRQRAVQKREIEELVEEFEQRMQAMQLSFRRAVDQNKTFDQIRQEIADLGYETKRTDQLRILEQEQAKAQEQASIAQVNQLQRSLKRRDARNAAILTVRRLEQEISDLQFARREFLSEHRLKVTDLITQIDLKKRDHAGFVRTLRRDIAEREQQNADRISILQQQVERERLQTEYEVRSATEKCQNLQNVYQTMTRRGNQQLSQLENDVQKLKRALELAERGEGKFVATSREELSKLHTLEVQTETIRTAKSGLNQELSQTETRNRQLASVLKQKQSSNSIREASGKRSSIFG